MLEAQPTMLRSSNFDKADADVVFKSSDGVLFALHKKNLSQHTAGFPPEDTYTGPDPIELSETAETLELMFQFVYPPDEPTLKELSFKLFIDLAYIAEKYMVYVARAACRMFALSLVYRYTHDDYRNKLKEYDREQLRAIVKYASEHSYMDIIDEAAPLLVADPLNVSILCFTSDLQATWALYRDQWITIHHDMCQMVADHIYLCSSCRQSRAYLGTLSNVLRQSFLQFECNFLERIEKKVETQIQGVQTFGLLHRGSRSTN